jgi:hypothetical protein
MDKKAALKNIIQLFENGRVNLPTTLYWLYPLASDKHHLLFVLIFFFPK